MLPTIGDHLVAQGPLCAHHGLYAGNGLVIHYPGVDDALRSCPIEETTLEQFTQGRSVRILRHQQRAFDGPTAIARARRRLGENGYHLFANNCEHFVNWCIDGDHRSDQVELGITVAGCGMTVGAAAAGKTAVARAGKVDGLSAPGVMSGLNAIGNVIGGGPARGLGVLATASAGAAAFVAAKALLANNSSHEPEERDARRQGRQAGYLSAVGGILLVMALVSELGAVKGLSAAGLSSGLAALGRPLGGGMGTGAGVAIAMPVALVFVVAYAIYKLSKNSSRELTLLDN